MRTTRLGLGFTVALMTAAPSLGGGASLTLLEPGLATDVTIDSLEITKVLVSGLGGISPVNIYESFMGSAYFPVFIGEGSGQSISAEGNAVAGKAVFDGQPQAARWTQAGGWESLGNLGATGGGTCQESSAYGITADGETVVGLAWENLCTARAFIWTSKTDIQALDVSGDRSNRASVISADGSIATGFGQAFSRSPTVWNTADGSVVYFDGETGGEFWGTTPDGTTVVGSSNGPAVYWNECEGIVPIGMLGNDRTAQGYDISADGTRIVGSSGTIFDGFEAFIWTPSLGIFNLQELLVALGVTIPDGVILEFALGISADGTTVVGRAFDPSVKGIFPFRAYVVTLPAPVPDPCPADFDDDGSVGFTDLTRLLGVWGPCACPSCPEDLDGDGSVGFTDLTDLLGVWGPCA